MSMKNRNEEELDEFEDEEIIVYDEEEYYDDLDETKLPPMPDDRIEKHINYINGMLKMGGRDELDEWEEENMRKVCKREMTMKEYNRMAIDRLLAKYPKEDTEGLVFPGLLD